MFSFLEKFKQSNNNKIPDPPYEYDMLIRLDKKDYPKYLEKGFFTQTGEKLDLKHPKTFNQKIQWIKLCDCTPLKTQLTDKVLVRDWVKERIGEEYLKPALWVGSSFDEIPFEELPNSIIIKANNGCKWHFRIKDKNVFLQNKRLFDIVKSRFDGWMVQSFFPYAGFEMQYKDIIPQIIIEPLLLADINDKPGEIEVYCFNGEPKISQRIKYTEPREVSVYDETFNQINLKFMPYYRIMKEDADDLVKLAVMLSDKLCKEFKLVRVDWLIFKDKLYFNEMTFTPFSGFYDFEDKEWNIKLGNMLDLKK